MGSAILIHTSAMPQDERGQALFNAFELLMHGMTEDLKFGQTDGVMMRSLVLTQYYYYGDSEFNPDDPEKQLIYCRNLSNSLGSPDVEMDQTRRSPV